MINHWIRIDGMCYVTKELVKFTALIDNEREIELTGHISIIINEEHGKYRLSRNSRVRVLSEEAYPTLALAKINMLKYITNNNL